MTVFLIKLFIWYCSGYLSSLIFVSDVWDKNKFNKLIINVKTVHEEIALEINIISGCNKKNS